MTWNRTIRNSKAVVNGVTYRAHNNQLVVTEKFGAERRYNVSDRAEAEALAEQIGAL